MSQPRDQTHHDDALDTDERLWTVEQLARFLALPVATIYAWRYRGEGPPALRIGRHVRFRPEDIEAWLQEDAQTCPVSDVRSPRRSKPWKDVQR